MNVRLLRVVVWGALCGFVVVVLLRLSSAAEVPNRRAALVREFGTLRCVEGRLTGGFGHGEHRASCLSPAVSRLVRAWRALEENPAPLTPEALADLGVFGLFHQKWDEAIAHLEEASARDARNARAASDLAAAYLERGRRAGRSLDIFLALVAAERAVAADPRLPEALFNQALAFERLGLRSRARRAWVHYLALETEPGWAAEGEERLGALEHATLPLVRFDRSALEASVAGGDRAAVLALVDPLRQRFRRLGEEELLAAWAEAHLARDQAEAARSLGLARALGESLSALSQDHLLRDSVAAIESASPARLETLARGHLEYRAGRSLYAAADYAGALGPLQAAWRDLARSESPFAWRAEFAAGSSEHFLSLRASALRRFTAVAERAASGSYRSLLGESLWMTGLAHFAERDARTALAAYRRGLAVFEAIEEAENIAGMQALLAEISDYEGEVERGWQHRLAALRTTLEIGDPQRLFLIYAEATMAATRQGEFQVALYFQEEALPSARQAKNPIAIAQGLFWRSRNHQELGLTDRASEDLRWARSVLEAVRPSQIKERCEADISLAEAKLAAETAPQEAIPLLSKALGLYLRGSHRSNLIDILRSRARAFERVGDLAAAEVDLESATRAIEQWRDRIETPSERISFLARSEQLFDALILLHLEGKRDPDRAFDTLERQRARALLDAVRPAVHPLTVRDVAARLPDNAVVVSYALLENRLMAFVVDRHGVRLVSLLSSDGSSIETRIAALRAGLAGHAAPGELDRRSGALYETLIAPLAAAIPAGARLILSGEGALQRLPFAALKNPRTGRYLVQEHTIIMAPSASVHLASVGRFRQRAEEGAPQSVLFVSIPVPDRRRRPELRPLRWTVEEARAAAALHPAARLLEGQEATVEAFLRDAPGAEIVHVLGHAIRESDVRGTCLVLASRPGAPDNDLLCGPEIERLRLDRTRLVILSACGTADGRITRGEGIESLARSFVAAGAPAVIGTSWDVRDRTAHLFLSELHRELRQGNEPAEALRRTQLRFLGGTDPDQQSPRFWANFQLTGGTS